MAVVTPIPRRWSGYLFEGWQSVEVDTGGVVYGDLAGNGHDDAGLFFDCNNGGGTAESALLLGCVIFNGLGSKLSVVGVVTPRIQPADVRPTHVDISIEPEKIIAREYFYDRMT